MTKRIVLSIILVSLLLICSGCSSDAHLSSDKDTKLNKLFSENNLELVQLSLFGDDLTDYQIGLPTSNEVLHHNALISIQNTVNNRLSVKKEDKSIRYYALSKADMGKLEQIVKPISISPDGSTTICLINDLLITVKGKTLMVILPINSRGVKDEYNHLTEYVQQIANVVGPEGVSWSRTGKYAVIHAMVKYTLAGRADPVRYIDPIIIDIQNNEFVLLYTSSVPGMCRANFDKNEKYLYYVFKEGDVYSFRRCSLLEGKIDICVDNIQREMNTNETISMWASGLWETSDGEWLLVPTLEKRYTTIDYRYLISMKNVDNKWALRRVNIGIYNAESLLYSPITNHIFIRMNSYHADPLFVSFKYDSTIDKANAYNKITSLSDSEVQTIPLRDIVAIERKNLTNDKNADTTEIDKLLKTGVYIIQAAISPGGHYVLLYGASPAIEAKDLWRRDALANAYWDYCFLLLNLDTMKVHSVQVPDSLHRSILYRYNYVTSISELYQPLLTWSGDGKLLICEEYGVRVFEFK